MKAYCCLLRYVFSLLIFFTMILSLMLHVLLLFSDYVIFLNYNKHICATYFYIF